MNAFTNRLKIIGLILSATILFAACSTGTSTPAKELTPEEAEILSVIDGFIDEMNSNPEKAYEDTAPIFKEYTNEDEFMEFIGNFAVLQDTYDSEFTDFDIEGTESYVYGTMEDNDDQVFDTVFMLDVVEGEWLVSGLEIELQGYDEFEDDYEYDANEFNENLDKAPVKTAVDLLDLNLTDPSAAYAATHSEFKDFTTEAEYLSLLDEFPVLGFYYTTEFDVYEEDSESADVYGFIEDFEDNTYEMNWMIEKEDGVWKVSGFDIEEF